VENGTLNPDFTPNRKTAAKMAWKLINFEDDKRNSGSAKEEGLNREKPVMPAKKRIRSRATADDPEPVEMPLEDNASKTPSKEARPVRGDRRQEDSL
jgi:hypothetical protein